MKFVFDQNANIEVDNCRRRLCGEQILGLFLYPPNMTMPEWGSLQANMSGVKLR